MATLVRRPLRATRHTVRKPSRVVPVASVLDETTPPAIPADTVRSMLLELAFRLHATKVVARRAA